MATKKRTGILKQRILKKLKSTFGAQITKKEADLLTKAGKLKRRKPKSKRVSSLPTAPKRPRKKKRSK